MQARIGPLLFHDRTRYDSPIQKRLLTELKRILMVGDSTPSWYVMRECGLEEALEGSNSSTAIKILQAGMLLSLQYDNRWSSHILSAMVSLTQSYMP